MNFLDDFLNEYKKDWYNRTRKSRITARVLMIGISISIIVIFSSYIK